MNNAVQKFRDNIDWSIVVSTVTATVLIGGSIYAMRKAGLGKVASVVSAGK